MAVSDLNFSNLIFGQVENLRFCPNNQGENLQRYKGSDAFNAGSLASALLICSPFDTRDKFPVRIHVLVIRLAGLKANPVANHENAHPMHDWSCRICNQPCAPLALAELVSNPTPPGQISRGRASRVLHSSWPRFRPADSMKIFKMFFHLIDSPGAQTFGLFPDKGVLHFPFRRAALDATSRTQSGYLISYAFAIRCLMAPPQGERMR
jgi:hypothetical protein